MSSPRGGPTHARACAPVTLSLTLGLTLGLGLACVVSPARAEPIDDADTPWARFVSPPDGTADVARFPVISARFDRELPRDPTQLAALVGLRDSADRPVPLRVWRSPSSPEALIATPASPDQRLEANATYELRVGPPGAPRRTRFETGTLPSVLCVYRRHAGGPWQSTCPGSTGDADGAGASCGVEPPGIDPGRNPCRCEAATSSSAVRSRCREEEALAGAPPELSVVIGIEPEPGARVAPGPTDLRITLDRELVEPERYYLRVLDVTDPSRPPKAVLSRALDYSDASFVARAAPLRPARRYRADLLLRGRKLPRDSLRGPQPHAVGWTFETESR